MLKTKKEKRICMAQSPDQETNQRSYEGLMKETAQMTRKHVSHPRHHVTGKEALMAATRSYSTTSGSSPWALSRISLASER